MFEVKLKCLNLVHYKLLHRTRSELPREIQQSYVGEGIHLLHVNPVSNIWRGCGRGFWKDFAYSHANEFLQTVM